MILTTKSVKARAATCVASGSVICVLAGILAVVHPRMGHDAPSEATTLPTLSNAEPVRSPALDISGVVQHGHIVEIFGSTDPGAVVMINGDTAAAIFDGSSFRHFVGPLPSGTTILSVTSQNQQGGVKTQKIAVTIE